MGRMEKKLRQGKMKNNFFKKVFKFWFPLFLWMLVIFSFSSFPTVKTSQVYWQDFIVKKLAHIIEYGILTTLSYRALINSSVGKKKAVFLSIAFAVLYGASDEFHQSFTPGREPRVRDVLFDTFGSVLFLYYIQNYLDKAPRKIRVWAEKLQIM